MSASTLESCSTRPAGLKAAPPSEVREQSTTRGVRSERLHISTRGVRHLSTDTWHSAGSSEKGNLPDRPGNRQCDPEPGRLTHFVSRRVQSKVLVQGIGLLSFVVFATQERCGFGRTASPHFGTPYLSGRCFWTTPGRFWNARVCWALTKR